MSTEKPARLLSFLLPRPDLVIVLVPPTGVVLARKQELPFDEIERQMRDWQAAAHAKRRVVLLDSSAPVDQLVRGTISQLRV
jgi:hypothetical protein